jgi:hypothetical protein
MSLEQTTFQRCTAHKNKVGVTCSLCGRVCTGFSPNPTLQKLVTQLGESKLVPKQKNSGYPFSKIHFDGAFKKSDGFHVELQATHAHQLIKTVKFNVALHLFNRFDDYSLKMFFDENNKDSKWSMLTFLTQNGVKSDRIDLITEPHGITYKSINANEYGKMIELIVENNDLDDKAKTGIWELQKIVGQRLAETKK